MSYRILLPLALLLSLPLAAGCRCDSEPAPAGETTASDNSPPAEAAAPTAVPGSARWLAVLDSERIAAVVTVERLDAWVRFLDRTYGALGDRRALVASSVPAWILDGEARTKKLGADVATAAGWAALGLDAEWGVALITPVGGDDPLRRPPVVALRVLNRDALVAALGSLGVSVELDPAGSASQRLRVFGAEVAMHTRDDLVFFSWSGAEALVPLVADVGSPLSALAPELELERKAEHHVLRAWASPKALGFDAAEPWATWVAATIEGPRFGLRAHAPPPTRTALLRAVTTSKQAPDVRSMAAAGDSQVRLALHPGGVLQTGKELFGELPSVASALSAFPAAVESATGSSWERWVEAWSGHLAYVGPLETFVGTDDPTAGALVIGIADDLPASQVLDAALLRVEAALGVKRAPLKLDERQGEKLVLPAGRELVAVQGPTALLWGTSAQAVERALGAGAKRYDFAGPAAHEVLAISVPPVGVRHVVARMAESLATGEETLLLGEDIAPFDAAIHIDDRGLLLTAEPLALALGVGAMVLESEVRRYQRAAMASEARIRLRVLVDSAQAYALSERVDATGEVLTPRFPESAPLTPVADPCAGWTPGAAPSVEAADSDWSAPGWQQLNFAPTGRLYYRYRVETSPDGKRFDAYATADLDCDSVPSTLRLGATLTDDHRVLVDSTIHEDSTGE